MRKLVTVAVLVLALGVGATVYGSRGGGAAKPGPATPPTSAAGADDVAMVDQVLAGLDGVMGDLQRILVHDRKITTDVTDRLRAIYTGPELLNQIDAFRADVDGGLLGYKATPGNRVTRVSRLITVSPICMFAEVKRDYSPISVGLAPKASTLYVVLVSKDDKEDPKHLNPTSWTMLYDGVQADGAQPEDICR